MTESYSYPRKVIIAMAIAVLFLSVIALVVSSVKILLLIFSGILFAVPLIWLVEKSQCYFGGPRGLHLAALLLIISTLVIGLVAVAVPALVTQAAQLIERIPATLERVRDLAQRYPFSQPLAEALANPQQWLQERGLPVQAFVRRLPGVFSTTVSLIAIPLLVILLGAYFTAEPRSYQHGLVRLFPVRRRPRLLEVMAQLGHTLRWWLCGQAIAMTAIGVTTWIFLMVLDIPLALLLAVITALANFIPNIGPFIAGIPTALLALTVGPWHTVAVIAFFVVVQNLEGSILMPMIQRRIISMPPVLVITAQILLSSLIGIAGVILAVPLIACAIVLVRMLYVEDVLEGGAEGVNRS